MANFVNDNKLNEDLAINSPPVRPATRGHTVRSPPWPKKFLETYHAGEAVFRAGAAAESIWEVVEGAVAFTDVSSDGRRIVIGFAFQGELIGVSQAGYFIHDAEALTVAKLVRVPIGTLTHFGRHDHDRRRVDAMASLLTSSLIMQTGLLMRRSADSRIAAFLVSVVHRLPAGDERDSLTLPMTREDIGNFVGMTAESVCRSLASLQKAGVLVFENARLFRIKDFSRLLRLATGD